MPTQNDFGGTARLAVGTVIIEPLANKRQIRDLVTEIMPPKERLKGTG
jgi:succinate dehydrogenase/fumarate reductase-like Fe-S protein